MVEIKSLKPASAWPFSGNMANNEMSGYGPPEGLSWPLLQHQSLFCVLLWIIFVLP